MTNRFSRSQILKASGAFIAGAAAAKSLPLVIGNEPAQAQTGCQTSLCARSSGGFSSPQGLILQNGFSASFARLRFREAIRPFWDIAVGGSDNVMNFFNELIGNVMTLTESGNVRIAGSLQQASSRELKESIIELSSQEAVEALKGLSPVKFNYKANREKEQHIGFIAEDVPELVSTPDRKGLSSMDIVGVLTKVVQEQQQTISALAEKVTALEEHKAVS